MHYSYSALENQQIMEADTAMEMSSSEYIASAGGSSNDNLVEEQDDTSSAHSAAIMHVRGWLRVKTSTLEVVQGAQWCYS